jgi:dolichol kinase
MTGTSAQITYASEIARKGIHLASLLIPIIYLQLDHWTGIVTLCVMTAISLLIDMLLHVHPGSRRLLLSLVGPLLRQHELREDRFHLTGASWVLIAATLTFLVFPTTIAVTAFSVLIVSDTFAALIGRRYGHREFIDKSLAGSMAFALSAFGVVAAWQTVFSLPMSFFIAGAIASVAAAIAEAASSRLRLDDNIAIPCSYGIVHWLVSVLLPSF